jgi:hypothetical protein
MSGAGDTERAGAMGRDASGDEPLAGPTANPGYAFHQLAKAIVSSERLESPEARARAAARAEAWRHVLAGMAGRTLRVGSRTPVAGTPAWATLEVLRGGFASGALAAEGDLQPHERTLLARLGRGEGATDRADLNAHFLGDQGTAWLAARLADGRYRVGVPEEGALLVAAWLVEAGQAGEARVLVEEIAPWFGRLRFYPVPHERPLPEGDVVRVQDAGTTAAQLEALRIPERIHCQRETLAVWNPLHDRVVALFLETVEGDRPCLPRDPGGGVRRRSDGLPLVEGGWPCARYPEGWAERARATLAELRDLRSRYTVSSKPTSARGNLGPLLRLLERCVADPARLTGREVGKIRVLLAAAVGKRGLPDSPRCRELRERQARWAALPAPAELAHGLASRLRERPSDEGIEGEAALEALLAPVTEAEVGRFSVTAGTPIPPRFAAVLARSLDATIGALVERGVVRSGEMLARLVPPLSASVRAAAVPDPALRRLYRAIYVAFRRRRSLLLFNLASQVKLEELPWVRACERRRTEGAAERASAREALERVVALALTAFPHAILPNKLLQEIRALSSAAGLELPIVDELAADIFMGDFSAKFLRAAQVAAQRLGGTLYARYYGLPSDRDLAFDDLAPRFKGGPPTSRAFRELCCARAGATPGRSVAANGAVIEQAQVLTTQNLAVLFDALGFERTLRLEDLARRTFDWAGAHLPRPGAPWRTSLRAVKNVAYAWRQMVFYLSLLPGDAQARFLAFTDEHLSGRRGARARRLQPALEGLRAAARGETLDGSKARCLLGWTTSKHWLLAPG